MAQSTISSLVPGCGNTMTPCFLWLPLHAIYAGTWVYPVPAYLVHVHSWKKENSPTSRRRNLLNSCLTTFFTSLTILLAMQRPTPLHMVATSPIFLHHPIPKHHIPIPVMYSPSLPPTPNFNSPYSPQSAQHTYGGFFSDPTAQLAFQVGGRATEAAGAYVEQNVCHPPIPPARPRRELTRARAEK